MKRASFESIIFERHIEKINSAIKEINDQLETIQDIGIEFEADLGILKEGVTLRYKFCDKTRFKFDLDLNTVIKKIYRIEK